MASQICAYCRAPGTHRVYAEVRSPLAFESTRIVDLFTCEECADRAASALKHEMFNSDFGTSTFRASVVSLPLPAFNA